MLLLLLLLLLPMAVLESILNPKSETLYPKPKKPQALNPKPLKPQS